MEYIFVSVLTLGGIALVSAAVLYFCSRKFAVKSDARVGEIYELLLILATQKIQLQIINSNRQKACARDHYVRTGKQISHTTAR